MRICETLHTENLLGTDTDEMEFYHQLVVKAAICGEDIYCLRENVQGLRRALRAASVLAIWRYGPCNSYTIQCLYIYMCVLIGAISYGYGFIWYKIKVFFGGMTTKYLIILPNRLTTLVYYILYKYHIHIAKQYVTCEELCNYAHLCNNANWNYANDIESVMQRLTGKWKQFRTKIWTMYV